MNVSLYRKWRPNTFSDVIGQKEIVDTLLNQMKENKLSHAYMFIGTRGTGKTSTAKILAKAVNCLAPNIHEPCGKCKACESHNSSIDIIEFDAASKNGVDDIRRIVDHVAYTPAENKYKVYIIDEVHMLSKGAFNALLKTLEEPPEYVIFILATTEPNKVPATIRSRCLKFQFKRIGIEDIVQRMQYICEKEERRIELEALRLIAANSDGAMRDALSMLEQAFHVSEDEVLTESVVANMLGCSNQTSVIRFVESILNLNLQIIVSFLHQFIRQGKDEILLLQDTVQILRDCMMLKSSNNRFELDNSSEYKEALENLSNKVSLERILYILNEVNALYNKAKTVINPLLVIETGVTMLCLPALMGKDETNIPSIVTKLELMDEKINSIVHSDKIHTKEVVFEEATIVDPVDITNFFAEQPSSIIDERVEPDISAISTEKQCEKSEDVKEDLTCSYKSSHFFETLKTFSSMQLFSDNTISKLIQDIDALFVQFPAYMKDNDQEAELRAELYNLLIPMLGEEDSTKAIYQLVSKNSLVSQNIENTVDGFIKELKSKDMTFATLMSAGDYEVVAKESCRIRTILPFSHILESFYGKVFSEKGFFMIIQVDEA
ncbi:MAG: DNA polymerase III subunit gamma/tau [Clostridia bacterium]